MKTWNGIALGLIAYGLWKLSDPPPGEPDDLQTRLKRLSSEWTAAKEKGKIAGEARKRQMESEFEAILARKAGDRPLS
jgi:hypothetical protein